MQNCADVKHKNSIMIKVVVALGIATMALAIAMAVVTNELVKARTHLENDYTRSIYEASDNLSNIEVNLGKLLVTSSSTKQQQLAGDIFRQAQTTASCFASVPLDSEGIVGATRFVNQLGDYCYYAGKKMAGGAELLVEERANLEDLYTRCAYLSRELKHMIDNIGKYNLLESLANNKTFAPQIRLDGDFSAMSKDVVDYPALIYDGPFSDASDSRDYKSIAGLSEIGVEEGKNVVRAMLSCCKILGITSMGVAEDAENSLVKVLEYRVSTDCGERYVQLTAKGGRLLNLSGYRSVDGVVLSEEIAKQRAINFVRQAGFGDMEAVWIMTSDRVAYVNLAPMEDGAVLYPDLVKVKVALDNGEVLGVEGTNYLLNHVERDMFTSLITEDDAKTHLNTSLKVDSVRLAVIPKGDSEVLCYEFFCGNNGLSYIIYLDANSGEEVDILRVVDTAQGRLLV